MESLHQSAQLWLSSKFQFLRRELPRPYQTKNQQQPATLPKGRYNRREAAGVQELENKPAPALQGATNGTIGPAGSEATYITGLQAGSCKVRVNNLANLEALLNLIANLFEISFALAGFAIIVSCPGDTRCRH